MCSNRWCWMRCNATEPVFHSLDFSMISCTWPWKCILKSTGTTKVNVLQRLMLTAIEQCNWACCHLLDVQPIVKLCRPFYFVHFHIWCIVHTTPQSTAGYCPPTTDPGSDKAMQCNATEPVVMLRAAFQLWGYNATQYIMDVWKCQYTTKPVYDFGRVDMAKLASRAIFLQ